MLYSAYSKVSSFGIISAPITFVSLRPLKPITNGFAPFGIGGELLRNSLLHTKRIDMQNLPMIK